MIGLLVTWLEDVPEENHHGFQ